jgi:hypothetical protein
MESGEVIFEERREFAKLRQAIILANEELQERELIKLARLATALAGALRQRGVPDPVASLTAEAGIASFRVAFESWVADSTGRRLSQFVRSSVDALKAATAAN